MWHLKTTTVPVKVGMVKKETDKNINKIHVNLSLHEIQKNHWTLHYCSSPKYYQYSWKISPKIDRKKRKYIECI